MSKEFLFDNAQICKAGHVVNIYKYLHSECNVKHCLLCPEEVISECPSCHQPIRGGYYCAKVFSQNAYTGDAMSKRHSHTTTHIQELTTPENYQTPAYCHECGKPYPWTETLIKEADAIIDSFDELEVEQQKLLKERFPDLLSETPRSLSAALEFSKLIKGLNSVASAVGKGFLISLLEKHVPETLFTLMQLR